ncbi:putative secreted hydrolase [Alloactinosynnema sp. L-07]|uniref:SGNH/GDSL hydrolase family protein n=1 Tax=Alloactinosynnema sp. L-07 TaxID=1653480 RepID=UPI00065F050A|nr:SGNH/GDSL hydrolase family protein [Alloactinosynnema sp. L-07]CRK57976.1 putative secreted hydrolase [Alloactinosynnema sp. L-07]
MKRRIALAVVLAATSLLVTVAPSQAAEPLNYVALGDSYSAGSGVLPLDPAITPLCARTTRNYPNLIAKATGAQFTDMTCGGAQTKDFAAAQYPLVTQPQFTALSAETDLVTLTIGGNDANIFISAIAACGSAGVVTLGFGSPCKTIYGNHFDNQIDSTVYPAVLQALRDLRAKAPNARVAILGYPWIMPASDGCFLTMPIAKGDVPYLRNLQAHLNQVIATAASQTGVTFVDLAAASEGHDACKPIGTRWVEPALWGTNFVPVHPNALGEAKMAERAMAVLGL